MLQVTVIPEAIDCLAEFCPRSNDGHLCTIGVSGGCFLERLRAHHCDDAVRVINFFLGELGDRTKRRDLAGLNLCLQRVFRLLAPNYRDFWMEAIFGRNLAYDLHQPVDMRIAAAPSR